MPGSLSKADGRPTLLSLLSAIRKNWRHGKPQLSRGSERGALLILGSVVVSAFVLGAKKKCNEEDDRGYREKFLSHPMVAWFIENSCCLSMAALTTLLVPRPTSGNIPQSAFSVVCGSILSEVVSNFLMLLCSNLYKHVPLFSETGRPTLSVWGMFQEWIRCHMWIDIVNALSVGAQTAALAPNDFFIAQVKRDFSPAKFLLKFAIVRVWSDVGFWLGHRALHHPVLYNRLHRKHHEHSRPSLATNYHFDPIDFWIEAFLPLTAGLITLDKLGLKPVRFEASLMINYIIWHAVGSHSGKALPVVTWFPPLAPLYQLVTGPEHGARHHDVHHARLNCNYSLSVWPDILFGTRLENHKDPIPGKAQMPMEFSNVEGPSERS